jgi:hypothetical protein
MSRDQGSGIRDQEAEIKPDNPQSAIRNPQSAIESLILANGWRGIDRVARHLPPDYAARAARALWDARQRVLITTGFYVGGHPETDGPPGAFFLGRALARCGAAVGFVADPEPLALLRGLYKGMGPGGWGLENVNPQSAIRNPQLPTPNPQPPAPEFIEFPIADAVTSRAVAERLTATWQPTAIVAVERCGRTCHGQYLSMRRLDITPWTAQVDDLFAYPPAVTVGIGDGGNEIGMGGLADQLTTELGLAEPALTAVQYPVLATVSNWGAYGLIAYLSLLAGHNLLHSDAEETAALERLIALGAVAGVTGLPEPIVDGFSPEMNLTLLAGLRTLVVNSE